ncbi:hypothetical protein SETIT_4G150600v2 [Setaria italica]|uniref:Uncharacterized protein n=1 Tax=Setaria italica TaxID=4555 RepID=A0A368QUG7_SETIT|nr:hypothetical protein SETIT_4G150600v2 [Setaria italica]
MFHLFCIGFGGPLPDPGEIRAGKNWAAAMVDNLGGRLVVVDLSVAIARFERVQQSDLPAIGCCTNLFMMLHIVVFFVSSLLLSLLQCCKRCFFVVAICLF